MSAQTFELCEDIVNYGIWLNSMDHFKGNMKRFFPWLFCAIFLIAIQITISIDVINEIGLDTENIANKDLTRRQFFVKLGIGLIIYAPIANGIYEKLRSFLAVVESEASYFMKFIFMALIYFQMI